MSKTLIGVLMSSERTPHGEWFNNITSGHESRWSAVTVLTI